MPKPPHWPDGLMSEAIAEGLNILAGKIYRASARKNALISITLDREFMLSAGLPLEGEGTKIATSVGYVEVKPSPAQSPFAGIDRSVAPGIATWATPATWADQRAQRRAERLAFTIDTPVPSLTDYWPSENDDGWVDRDGNPYEGPCASCAELGSTTPCMRPTPPLDQRRSGRRT